MRHFSRRLLRRHSRRLSRCGVAAALSVLVAVSLAGCAKPGGVDGDLTDQWAALGVPTGFTPTAGTCHLANFSQFGPRASYEEVDCQLVHRTETVHVGEYPSPAAEAPEPPANASAAARAAYATCDKKTTEYVGGPWRTARLWIGVTQPTRAAWAGGARWFRCEVVVSSSVEDDGGLVQRVGTLRGALQEAASPLLLTCYRVLLDKDGEIGTMPAAPCSAPHNAEFVGVWDAGDRAYPKTTKQWDAYHDGCRGLIASYVGVPDDADLQYRAGVVSLPGGDDVWELGDRGVRCYLWVDTNKLKGSLKGKGQKALPVQYQ
ncbi:septum formation family protein [Couchioplanes caeruleus]|uniref:Putative regulator of septum formation n=1 Tax=Couchioplanes caeruleus TaxID=56438 RepID=A0A3N1GMT2_9ACTN|nr:septum formation family protein [Couchioplanes caeruleus]ROP31555.1 putative regulator of septum formation [Couchioplanes caeruleus]